MAVKLEYYTLDQAARALECFTDEVEHFIMTEKLVAHLYAKSKTFVVVEVQSKDILGRGVGTYTGLIKIDQKFARTLLDNKSITLDKPVALTQPEKVNGWSEKQPYTSSLFLKAMRIDEWVPFSGEFAASKPHLLAISLPDESPGLMRMAMGTLEKIAENTKTPIGTETNSQQYPELTYSFKKQGSFDCSALRIRHEDLMSFRGAQLSEASDLSTIDEQSKGESISPPVIVSRERVNELHVLLIDLISANPRSGARGLWRLLKREASSVSKSFDTNEILQEVTDSKLAWISSHGNHSELSWSSFPSTVSQIKKELKL